LVEYAEELQPFNIMRWTMRPYNLFLGVIILLLSVAACQKKENTPHKRITSYTVKAKPFSKTLYFSSTIEPVKTTVVASPVEGLIKQSYFKYGQLVKKNQSLLALSSTKVDQDYTNVVLDFLKAKKTHQEKYLKFLGSQALWKKGVISKNNYMSQRDAYEEAYVSQLKARHSLEKMMALVGGNVSDVDKLSLSDRESIAHLFNKEISIKIYAPVPGIVLPAAEESALESDVKTGSRLGDKVKEDQALLDIGDISGFSLQIDVDEISVNQIKAGLPVTIRGDAFPGYTLKGEVKSVGINQVKKSGRGSRRAALFPVNVVVKQLTPDEQRDVHIGMSAKVAIHLPPQSRILIPIGAILQKNNRPTVMLIDKRSGKPRPVFVLPGNTTQKEVVINQGLKPGDSIQVFHND